MERKIETGNKSGKIVIAEKRMKEREKRMNERERDKMREEGRKK